MTFNYDLFVIGGGSGGVRAARAADLPVAAFPNENTAGHDWSEASGRVDAVSLDDLLAHVGR